MIASIHGEVIGVAESALIVNVGGMGFQVFVPTSVQMRTKVHDVVSLFTHLVVREDLLALYGFDTLQERDFFDLLLGVQGIGPRTALAILSVLSVEAIRRAVLAEQADVFCRVPGIGKKSAQKIVLFLQGKVDAGDVLVGISNLTDVDAEVQDALVALGYSVVEAQTAIQSIPREASADVEERLRIALAYFSR